MTDDLTPRHVEAALRGDSDAVAVLVDTLTPVIQARVARALLRRKPAALGRNIRQEIEDFVQEVFVALFRHDGKALRAWEPGRGMGLKGYVGMVAEQQGAAILRSRRRSPWTEDPTLQESMVEPAGESPPTPEQQAISKLFLQRLLDCVRAELSPLGMQLFQLVLVEQRPIDDVTAATGMNRDAVYAWRSRLRKLVRRVSAELTASEVHP